MDGTGMSRSPTQQQQCESFVIGRNEIAGVTFVRIDERVAFPIRFVQMHASELSWKWLEEKREKE